MKFKLIDWPSDFFLCQRSVVTHGGRYGVYVHWKNKNDRGLAAFVSFREKADETILKDSVHVAYPEGCMVFEELRELSNFARFLDENPHILIPTVDIVGHAEA